ncbi:MAG: response regulator, partial [Actinomycetota bacterium]
GLDLCRRLREYAPQTPILFYSGYVYETDKRSGLEAGANAYLTKPYIDDLTETISMAIKLAKKPVAKSFNNSFFEVQNRNEEQTSI